jgi:lysophospholipase L1-like esterase
VRASAVLLVLLAGCSGARTLPRPQATPADAMPAMVEVPVVPDARPPPPCDASDADAKLAIEDGSCGALTGFFERLRAGGRAAVVQFGDSHTAIDQETSRMRVDLQKRFGDAGRGLVLAGRPVKYYDQRDAVFEQTGTWTAQNGLHHAHTEPFGIAGVRNTSSEAGATITVGTCTDCEAGSRVSHFELFYLQQPAGGTMKISIDGTLRDTVSTAADASADGYYVADVDDGAHTLSVEVVGDGSVELFGVVMERAQPGAVLDALGVGGVEGRNLLHWDWTYIGPQLQRRDPALVILQYGTNETGRPEELTPEILLDTYTRLIQQVKAAVPGVSILVLGPPDKDVRELGKKCAKLKPDAEIPEGCEWKTPPILQVIIDAERQAAADEGVAFVDLDRFMGGAETIDGWANLDTPLARKDHTHLTRAGYDLVADTLYDELMRSYDRYFAAMSAD